MGLSRTAAYSAAAGGVVAAAILAITVSTQHSGSPASPALWALRNVAFTGLWPGWYVLLGLKFDAPLTWSDSWFAVAMVASNALLYGSIGSCICLGRRKSRLWYGAALSLVGLMVFVVINGPLPMFELVLWLQAHGQRVH